MSKFYSSLGWDIRVVIRYWHAIVIIRDHFINFSITHKFDWEEPSNKKVNHAMKKLEHPITRLLVNP